MAALNRWNINIAESIFQRFMQLFDSTSDASAKCFSLKQSAISSNGSAECTRSHSKKFTASFEPFQWKVFITIALTGPFGARPADEGGQ